MRVYTKEELEVFTALGKEIWLIITDSREQRFRISFITGEIEYELQDTWNKYGFDDGYTKYAIEDLLS